MKLVLNEEIIGRAVTAYLAAQGLKTTKEMEIVYDLHTREHSIEATVVSAKYDDSAIINYLKGAKKQ